MSEAYRLAGTASVGDGTAAIARAAAVSLPASSTALVISSTNKGIPSVRSMMSCRMLADSWLSPTTRSIMAAGFVLCQSIDEDGVDVRPSNPRRVEFRPERHEQQHLKCPNSVYNPTERFQAGWVGPLRI